MFQSSIVIERHLCLRCSLEKRHRRKLRSKVTGCLLWMRIPLCGVLNCLALWYCKFIWNAQEIFSQDFMIYKEKYYKYFWEISGNAFRVLIVVSKNYIKFTSDKKSSKYQGDVSRETKISIYLSSPTKFNFMFLITCD